ncbi:MAG TPA: 2-hydroxyacid dehydrogenase [Actinomycetota bacterium]|jgi:phosphoglycerate dehydrogenase-like enzyme|nr:2-hydroxyacid dehydrogenase [Actinomycetota bacterium]
MRLLALFPSRMNPEGIAQFVASSLGDDWEVTGAGAPDDDVGTLEQAEAILAALVDVSAAAIDKASNLRLIQTPSHGFDHIDIEAAARKGVPVCNVGTSGAEAATVAEHAILLMLACARRLTEAHDGLRAGEWPQMTGSSVELQGKTLGIVGLGHIGCEVAKRAHAFDMRLLYHDVVPAPEGIEQDLGLTRLSLDEVLEQADVVTVHVPLMAATRGLIGAAEIAKMKREAILVNTSRGAVVDNVAVAQAADEGRIIAGIDVYEPEPPPSGHPLRSARNVVLTPHQAGTTRESVVRIMAAALENLGRFARGEQLQDVVNGVQM